MPTISTIVKTTNASRYMQQLCKHFAHKVEAEFDASEARVQLPPGPCVMTASESELSIYCRSESDRGIEVSRGIIDSHIHKFAWREELVVTWMDGLPDEKSETIQRKMDEIA